MKEFHIYDVELGSLAKVSKLLSDAGVNILGVSAESTLDFFKLITNSNAKTREALSKASIEFIEAEILVLLLPDEPGMLLKTSKSLSDSGVNILSTYLMYDPTLENKEEVLLAIRPDHMLKAKEILKEYLHDTSHYEE